MRAFREELHEVDYSKKLKKSLALPVRRNQPRAPANLRPDSQVAVILSDLEGWSLVRSENGVMGWMREPEVEGAFGNLIRP